MHASRVPGNGQVRFGRRGVSGRLVTAEAGLPGGAPSRRLRTPLRLLAVVGAASLAVMLVSPLAEAGKPVPPLYKKGAPTDARVLFILCNWGSQFSYQPYGLKYFRKLWTAVLGERVRVAGRLLAAGVVREDEHQGFDRAGRQALEWRLVLDGQGLAPGHHGWIRQPARRR